LPALQRAGANFLPVFLFAGGSFHNAFDILAARMRRISPQQRAMTYESF
jgi:hypothetical protein